MQMKLFKTVMKGVLRFHNKEIENISFWEVYSAAMLAIRLSVRYSLWVEEEKKRVSIKILEECLVPK